LSTQVEQHKFDVYEDRLLRLKTSPPMAVSTIGEVNEAFLGAFEAALKRL
jgi:hypothetical protein